MASKSRSWRVACGKVRRYYVRNERGSVVASGDDLEMTMARARAACQTGELTVDERNRDGSRVGEAA